MGSNEYVQRSISKT